MNWKTHLIIGTPKYNNKVCLVNEFCNYAIKTAICFHMSASTWKCRCIFRISYGLSIIIT